MSAFKYGERILLGELFLADCSITERIMHAVLIVDDDHAFRTILRTLFEEGSGFDNCVEAANAFEALNKTKQLTPDLAIVAFSITAVFSKLDDLTTLIANARAVCGLE